MSWQLVKLWWRGGMSSVGAVTTAMMLLVACGDGSPQASVAVGVAGGQSSQPWVPITVALPAAPVGETEFFMPDLMVESVRVTTAPTSDQMLYTADESGMSACNQESEVSVLLVPAGIDRLRFIYLYRRPLDDGLVLLIAGEKTGSPNKGVLHAYLDSNADGFFATTDLVVEVSDSRSLAGGSSWSSVVATDNGEAYVVDAVNHEVLRLTDSNADEIPDALQSTVFFDSTQSAGMGTVGFARLDSTEGCVDLFSSDPMSEPVRPRVRARDTDADGRADEMIEAGATLVRGARFARLPIAGDLVLKVADSSASQPLEVWKLDGTAGDEVTLLGSVTTGTANAAASITLSVALAEGDFLRVRPAVADGDSSEVIVSEHDVEVFSVSPATVSGSGTETVTLDGWRFDTGVVVAVRFPTTSALPDPHVIMDVPVTVLTSGQGTFVLPAPTETVADGTVSLVFMLGGKVIGESTIGLEQGP